MTPEENINDDVPALNKQSLQDNQKKAFLDAFKELGYKNKACDKLGIPIGMPTVWSKTDAKFALDYDLIKAELKDRRKEVLDIYLYENGQTSRGFMDRMAWFRSQGYEEYNPKSTVKKESPKTEEALKKLIDKLDKYKGEKGGKGKA